MTGSYVFGVQAQDSAGNLSAAATVSFFVVSNTCTYTDGSLCPATFNDSVGPDVPRVFDFGVTDSSCQSFSEEIRTEE